MSSRVVSSIAIQGEVIVARELEKLMQYLTNEEKETSVSKLLLEKQRLIEKANNDNKVLTNITPYEEGIWKRVIKTWLGLNSHYDNERKYTDFEKWFMSDMSVIGLEKLKHNYLFLNRIRAWHDRRPLELAIVDSIRVELEKKYQQLKKEYETSK